MAGSKKSVQKQLTQSLIEKQGMNFREWEEEQLNQVKVDLMMNPRQSSWNEILKEAIYSKYLEHVIEKEIESDQKSSTSTKKSSISQNESNHTNYQNEKKEG